MEEFKTCYEDTDDISIFFRFLVRSVWYLQTRETYCTWGGVNVRLPSLGTELTWPYWLLKDIRSQQNGDFLLCHGIFESLVGT